MLAVLSTHIHNDGRLLRMLACHNHPFLACSNAALTDVWKSENFLPGINAKKRLFNPESQESKVIFLKREVTEIHLMSSGHDGRYQLQCKFELCMNCFSSFFQKFPNRSDWVGLAHCYCYSLNTKTFSLAVSSFWWKNTAELKNLFKFTFLLCSILWGAGKMSGWSVCYCFFSRLLPKIWVSNRPVFYKSQ